MVRLMDILDMSKKGWGRLVGWGLVVFMLGLSSQCYVVRQGHSLLIYQRRAQDIKALLADPLFHEEHKAKLLQVLEIKDFAVKRLGLNNDDNYSAFVPIEKDYLVDVVSASSKTRFADKTWWFPFFGSFPYKGFFDREDALALAEDLRKEGLDVLVRKVDAFSTLGFFDDPFYSFMLDYSEARLAALIIHEQAHATIFVKDHMDFNENLASFVEKEGVRAYLVHKYGPDNAFLKEVEQSEKDHQKFMQLIRELSKQLEKLYQSKTEAKVVLELREKIYRDFQAKYETEYERNFSGDQYRFFLKTKINNAYLRLFLLYEADLGIFYELFEKQGRDLARTIKWLKGVREHKGDPFEYLKNNEGF